MITKMKKYTFLVLASAYESFLEQLREAGVVHVTLKAEGMAENEQLQQTILEAEQLRHVIRQGAPDQLLEEYNSVLAKMEQVRRDMQRMEVWGDFSAKTIGALKDAGYTLYYYSCAEKQFSDELGVRVNEKEGRVYFVSVNVPIENDFCVAETLSDKCAKDLEKDMEALHALAVAAKARIEAWAQANIPSLEEQLLETQRRIDWQRVTLSTDSMAEGSLKLLEGFCPVENCEALDAMLADQAVYYEKEDPKEEDATPVKIHNNWFARLFEPLTGMYGWPNYNEFDPTPVLAPFYLLFFALCVGDAGYGLALILIGYLIYKDKLKIEMFSGLGPIIMALGVGCTVVGYLGGTFLGIDIYQAAWMPDWAKSVMFKAWIGDGKGYFMNYDIMMVMSLVIGVFHICLAMTIKAISYTLRYGFRKMASTWGWLLLIVGGIITAIASMVMNLSEQATSTILIVIAAISALGIFLFNTPGRNPLLNIGSGLWDTYNMVTGLLGDVLSYLRLYALGMAGAMLGAAFNDLGLTVLGESPNVLTVVGFVLIVVFGHVLNLLMACLGAFVHPLRLTFVEYFKNVGYEGTGKLYRPFAK